MARRQGTPPPTPTETPKAPPAAKQAPPRASGIVAGQALALHVDVLNEQIVIAATCLDADFRKRTVRAVAPEAFLHHEHRPIWVALQECERLKLEWSDALAARYGISPTLLDAILAGGIRPNLEQHVAWLHWDKVRTSAAMGPLKLLVEALRDPKSEQSRVRALARHVGEAFDHPTTSTAIDDPSEIERRIDREIDAEEGPPPPLGIPGLDLDDRGEVRITAGSAHGKITVLTGQSGSGKSTVAMEMIRGQVGVLTSAGTQRKVLAGAWEMGSEESIKLLACQHLKWDRHQLRVNQCGPSGVKLKHSPEERVQYEEARHLFHSYVRFWPDPPSRRREAKTKQLQNDANFQWMWQVIVDSGCDFILADLFRFALASTDPSDEDDFLNETRRRAKKERVHLVLGAQQLIKGEMGVDARKDKRPTQSGLKGSGGWTEMSDTTLGVFRQALHKRVPDDEIQIIGLKQRFGVYPFAVALDFHAPSGRISGGREIPYDQPGEVNDLDAFPMSAPKRKSRRDD